MIGRFNMAIIAGTICGSVAVAEPASRQELRLAKEALELHYIKNKIYYPVGCDTHQNDSQSWVFCTSGGGDGTIGGLYLVEPGPTVWAVNGKAIQHVDVRARPGSIELDDGSPLAVDRWRGETIDIPAILEAFS